MERQIFITGATGHIGARLASDAISGGRYDRVILLVRGESDGHARQRVLDTFDAAGTGVPLAGQIGRVEVVAGDVSREHLGLSSDRYDKLSRSVTHIIHSAGNTSFVQSYESARTANLVGTTNVMAFAERCRVLGRLQVVASLSTAYVNGPQARPIGEESLDSTAPSHNCYDISKWETERELRRRWSRLPLMIMRPSIVVGDSESGYTQSFNVLYVPLRCIFDGRVENLPGRSETRLDVVPVDYVSQAIHRIVESNEPGRTYHLVGGQGRLLGVEALVGMVRERCRRLGRGIPGIRFTGSTSLSLSANSDGDRVPRVLSIFAPYVMNEWIFDDTNTQAGLRGSGIACPRPEQYFDRLLDFCVGTDWGRVLRKVA